MKTSEIDLKPMSVGDIIDYSLEIYKRNFKKLTTLSLIFYIPFIFLYSLVISYLSADVDNVKNNISGLGNNLENLPYMFAAYYLSLLGMMLVYLVYSITIKAVFDAAIVKVVYSDVVKNKEDALKSVIKECFKRFKPLFLNRILYYLIMLGVGIGFYVVLFILLIVVIAGVASLSFLTMSASPIAGVILGIGITIICLLVLIPLAAAFSYFICKYGMGIPSVIIENKSASEAISRCGEISKRSFWSISMSFILGMLLFFTVPALISAGVQTFTSFNKVLFIISSTASQIIWALLNPFTTTLLTVIFINQKIKNEGLDLEIRVDKMIMESAKAVIPGDSGENKNDI